MPQGVPILRHYHVEAVVDVARGTVEVGLATTERAREGWQVAARHQRRNPTYYYRVRKCTETTCSRQP